MYYIGPAGWSYRDWQGIVYPPRKPRGFSELDFLSRYFNTIEINSSFYRLPSEVTVSRWIQTVQSQQHFKFCVKLWQRFTHQDEPPAAFEVEQVNKVFTPLLHAEKFGALLVQFPWRFKKTAEHMDRLTSIAEWFSDMPIVVEFRHASWMDDDAIALLGELKIGFTNIDQPVIGKSIQPSSIATTDIGYFRFHGRNYDDWFRDGAGRDARYDYLYSKDELQTWTDQIQQVSDVTEHTFIIFNNHFRGQAVVNAFQTMAMLQQNRLGIPEHLIHAYPQLLDAGFAEDETGTMNLF